jgi:hypothetical protein
MLTGAAVGLVVGAGAAGAAWHWRQGTLRPWAAAAGALGAAAGFAVARRKRWDDPEVALYLDGKLGSDETITTALELEAQSDAAAAAVVVSQATDVLDKAEPRAVRPQLWRPWHVAVPVAAAAIGYLSWIPLPPAPPAAALPPGVDKVQLADLQGLEKVIRLAELDARDDAQKKRLNELAEDAKKLREKLKTGVEKREARADVAKLRDGVTAERLSLGEGEQRQGLESAIGKLEQNPDMKGAAKALGDRDLTSFDEEMERLANKLEAKDREQAKKTLEEAAEAAKKAGAPGVAKALEEQKRLMDQRGKEADKLKELAKALGDGLPEDAKEALEDFEGSGSGKDQQKLAEKLEDALEKLTPEQRKKLAENLKKQIGKSLENGAEPAPADKQQLKDLAEQLSTPEGQERLQKELERLAEEGGPDSEESRRQQGLDQGQQGLDDTEKQLGGAPMPMPMAGGDKPGQGQGAGKDDKGKDSGGPGPGGGKGDHEGQTKEVDGKGVRSRADAKINKGQPMPGVVLGRSSGRAGDTANRQGTGALGQVAPQEVGGVERSDIPEEYREQVGRYFQPK